MRAQSVFVDSGVKIQRIRRNKYSPPTNTEILEAVYPSKENQRPLTEKQAFIKMYDTAMQEMNDFLVLPKEIQILCQ